MVALYPDLANMAFDKDATLNFVFVIDRCGVCAGCGGGKGGYLGVTGTSVCVGARLCVAKLCVV